MIAAAAIALPLPGPDTIDGLTKAEGTTFDGVTRVEGTTLGNTRTAVDNSLQAP